MLGKALFDLHQEREKVEENGNRDVRTVSELYNPNVSTG